MNGTAYRVSAHHLTRRLQRFRPIDHIIKHKLWITTAMYRLWAGFENTGHATRTELSSKFWD